MPDRCLLAIASLATVLIVAAGAQPSFDCDEAQGMVEKLICNDADLAALDRQLAAVWQQAMDLAQDSPDLPLYRAEQRGWIKGRNECWKAGEQLRDCVETSYRERIAEIQARWRLVEARGPFFFADPDQPADEITVTYFATDPPTAILERGDQVVVAFQRPAASGARYVGRNEELWTRGDEALVTWGFEARQERFVLRGQGGSGR